MSLKVLVIGSGQRVRRAALPALLLRSESFQIAGIYSRKPKQIVAEDKTGEPASLALEVQALAGLDAKTVAAADLIYVCVSKSAVPQVIGQLAGLARIEPNQSPALLIDTPVLYFKHMAANRHFAAFKKTWVAEDMSTLPWLDALDALSIGRATRLTLDRSAFAYHGVALAKTLLKEKRLKSARRVRTGATASNGEACHERRFAFESGASCLVLEPRNYSVGGFRLEYEHGAVADPGDGRLEADDLELACRFEANRCVGFQVTRNRKSLASTELAAHEIDLLGEFKDGATTGPIAHMDAMKRVGFARLLDSIASGGDVWSLHDGLDDMWIDYLTEKTGRWRRTPLTSAHAGLARGFVSMTMALASKIKR